MALYAHIAHVRYDLVNLLESQKQNKKQADYVLVNFTQQEFIRVRGNSKTLMRFDDLFEEDTDGDSRWNIEDDIHLITLDNLTNVSDLSNFQDVYGYASFDHVAGFNDHTVYTTDESRNAYYNR